MKILPLKKMATNPKTIVKEWWPNELTIATVDKLIDGDTIQVLIPWGDGKLLKWRCRLFGINTPELKRGNEASKENAKQCKRLLSKKLNEFEGVVLLQFHADKDSFGRLLTTVYCGKDVFDKDVTKLENVNEYMLAHGPGTIRFDK